MCTVDNFRTWQSFQNNYLVSFVVLNKHNFNKFQEEYTMGKLKQIALFTVIYKHDKTE